MPTIRDANRRSVIDAFNPALLTLFLCADAALLGVHVINRLWLFNPMLDIGIDGGYGEMFQYLKEYWIALVCAGLWWRRREGIYASWSLLFFYLLADDALSVHERMGAALAGQLQYLPVLGLRSIDLGEMTFAAVAGVTFLGLIAVFYFRASQVARAASHDLLLLFAVLVFFGVGVDMVHVLLPGVGLTMVEDGGELVAMTLIVCYVLRLFNHPEAAAGKLTAPILSRLLRPHGITSERLS